MIRKKYSRQGKPISLHPGKNHAEFPSTYIKKLLREASYKVEESEIEKARFVAGLLF
jgi:hypothetical protein